MGGKGNGGVGRERGWNGWEGKGLHGYGDGRRDGDKVKEGRKEKMVRQGGR